MAQVTAGSPEVLTYLHTDHLGTPRFGTNSGGSQVWAWDSDAFGNGAPSGAATVNLRMPGQYYDTESGLFYNWNRYYNPAIGRYISSDPIGLEGGLNTFNYVEQSPLMYTDPEGLIAGVDDVCIATAVGATIVAGILVTEYTKHCITPEKPASACPQNWIGNEALNNEIPADAKDPNGAKAPGKPGESEGFKDPKGGEKWVKDPNGRGYGWQDDKGNVWVPTGQGGSAHGGSHWDVQDPRDPKKHTNIYPGGSRR